jgi:hypothetical protein
MAASTSPTESQRHLRASIAANARWSTEDPAANAARGQAGLLARFEREAREAEPGLPGAEYARRAESARKAHMARLAFASSKVRGARRKVAPKVKEASLAKVNAAARAPLPSPEDGIARIPTTGEPEHRAARGRRPAARRSAGNGAA